MRLQNLRANLASVDVFFGSEKATVLYRPQAYNDETAQALKTAKEPTDGINGYLAALIASWDLEDEHGAIPVTIDGMRRVPVPIKVALVQAIERDVLDPSFTTASPSGTPRMEPSGNGTAAYPIGSVSVS